MVMADIPYHVKVDLITLTLPTLCMRGLTI